MTDIFIVLPSESVLNDGWVFMLIAVALSILVLIFLLYRKRSKLALFKLEYALKKDKLSPRDAAHCLAQLIAADNKKINKKIDQLRFQRLSPSRNDVQSIINKVKYDC